MLVACITICIYLMALHNYQFTYKSDICLLVPSILYPLIVAVPTIVKIATFYDEYYRRLCIFVGFGMPFLTNIVFTALTLVPLCCRACGYNLCMKTAATVESHRKAQKFIRNNLSKLRDKKKARHDNINDYGTTNQHRTHRTTAYTTEGISETCNTEYVVVSENEEDTRFLQQKNNRRQ